MWSNIEKVLKVSAFFSLFLIVIGNYYEYNYYYVFSINIYDYVSSSDIVSIFLGKIDLVIFTILLIGFIFLILFSSYLPSIPFPKFNMSFKESKPKFKSLRKGFRNLWTWRAILFFLLSMGSLIFKTFLGGSYQTESSNNSGRFVGDMFTLAFISYSITMITMLMFGRRRFLQAFKITGFVLALVALHFIDLCARFDASTTKLDNYTRNTYKLVTKDTTYITNDSLKYIGASSSSIFLFSRKNSKEKTIIVSRSDIIKPIEITSDIYYIYPFYRGKKG